MINTSRQVDSMLFYLEKDVSFGDVSVIAGWNHIKRVDKQYHVFSLENTINPYTFLHLDEMPQLLHSIYEKMINAGYIEELNDPVVHHSHLKKVA